MKITVHYEAQAKRAAGTASESVELADGATVSDALQHLVRQHGDPLQSILLDANGGIQPTLLLFVADQQIDRDGSIPLSDGGSLTIMTPISGG